MQITSTRITVRWRILALIACVLTASASTLMAQLRFSGPSNQAVLANPPPATFRTNAPVRQAQFQPAEPAIDDNAPPPPPSLAPQLPSASDELKVGPSTMTPSTATPSTAGSASASGDASESISSGTVVQEMPFPVSIMPMETTWQNNWGDSFDSEIMQQEQAVLYSTNAWFRRGFWYSQTDVVVMLRTETKGVHISGDNSGAGPNFGDLNAPVLTSKTVDPTYTPGARITLGRFLGQDSSNRDHTVEFSFLGLFEYSEKATLIALTPNGIVDALGPGNRYFTTGTTGLIIGASTPGFGDAKQHDIQYDSDLNSFEANFRILGRPLRDRLDLQPNGAWVRNVSASQLTSFLLGMRVMSINELFRLKATYAVPGTSGNYQVKTSNDMFGLQLGGDVVENYARWSWGARFKAGGLFNFADRRSNLEVELNGVARDPRAEIISRENLAAVVEGGMTATYQIRANLTARVAYDAMYITGIATAPENMGLGDTFPNFEVTGDAIFHGLSVGFEMLW